MILYIWGIFLFGLAAVGHAAFRVVYWNDLRNERVRYDRNIDSAVVAKAARVALLSLGAILLVPAWPLALPVAVVYGLFRLVSNLLTDYSSTKE